ncbi:MAG: lamin tail domain-containing protein [Flavobacteriales bacterium]|nr:lamin tail domain-containing protein [Flavobacteriales bacterium]
MCRIPQAFPRILVLLHVVIATGQLSAQFNDDFSDGDFTGGPVWSGNDLLFTVVNEELRSNSPGAATYYLSTPSVQATDARWEFFINLKFATSGTNYVDLFLMSDAADLGTPLNGYFVRVGGTQDRVELFRRDGGSSLSLIASPDGIVNSSTNNPFRIRVERDVTDSWTLWYDDGALGSYTNAGTVVDATHQSSTHFGIWVVQSSAAGPVNNHFFDDFTVGPIPVDLDPPNVLSVTAVSATQVDVLFDEPVDPATAQDANNYDILPFIAVAGAVLAGSNAALVHLTPGSALGNGGEYGLLVGGVQDLAGNALVSGGPFPFSFITPDLPAYREVVINELMADPSPVVGLPDAEFVELFNATTDKYFDLAGWKFSDASSTVTLPAHLLGPGEFVILVSTSNLALFSAWPNRIGLGSLPSLNNDADQLTLRYSDDTAIDRVNYSSSWYRDGDKAEGGWTLEQIDPFNPCSGALNWIASTNELGGTPGEENSVLDPTPDTTPPALTGVLVNSDTQVTLLFSEALDSSAVLTADYAIDPPLSIAEVTNTPPGYDRVGLIFATALVPGIIHTLTVSGLTDCAGNAIGDANTATFALPEVIAVGDVVINEVLYDPISTGSDFVELFNRSQKVLSLAGLQMANVSSGVIANFRTITTEPILLMPGEYILLTPNPTDIATRYPQSHTERFLQMSLPSYVNTAGSVVFCHADNSMLDRFDYSDRLHFTLLSKTEGVSLERVDPARPTSDNSNWTSAAQDAGWATPGFRNSQYAPAPAPTGEMTIDPAIFSPDNDGHQDLLTITYRFDQPGFVGNMTVFDLAGREVKRLMENILLGTRGAISWDGIRTEGDKARIGPYIIWFEVYDLSGNIEVYRKTVTLAHRLD